MGLMIRWLNKNTVSQMGLEMDGQGEVLLKKKLTSGRNWGCELVQKFKIVSYERKRVHFNL